MAAHRSSASSGWPSAPLNKSATHNSRSVVSCSRVRRSHLHHLLRDLRLGLPTHTAHAVVGKLVADGVRSAFALRNNLVHFKKIILGIHQTNILLVHDCRRLSTFFREPLSQAHASTGGGGGGVAAQADDDGESKVHRVEGRGYIRSSRSAR